MADSKIKAELDAPFALTEEQKTSYRDNGFVRLKSVLSPDLLAHYENEIDAAVAAASEAPPMDEQMVKDNADPSYGKAFQQIINLWRTNPQVRELAFSKRLARIAAELMGVSGVRIYHDQALYKPPGGGHTPYHADQFYWPLSSDKTVTAWIPLQPVTDTMGALEFVAGSHKADLGRGGGIGAASDAAVGAAVAAGSYSVVKGAFDLGEFYSFHAGWTFHRAGPNASDLIRRIFTVIWMDREIRMAAPENDNQRADARRYLIGVHPGEVCAGPANPLVWKDKKNEFNGGGVTKST